QPARSGPTHRASIEAKRRARPRGGETACSCRRHRALPARTHGPSCVLRGFDGEDLERAQAAADDSLPLLADSRANERRAKRRIIAHALGRWVAVIPSREGREPILSIALKPIAHPRTHHDPLRYAFGGYDFGMREHALEIPNAPRELVHLPLV